jgi:hypothetical protein
VQVEKFLLRYETLAAERGKAAVRAGWSAEEHAIADEFIAHARALRAERAAATAEGRAPRIAELQQSWGGATIAYRKRMIDSPSYTLNHEEIEALRKVSASPRAHSVAVEVTPSVTPRATRRRAESRRARHAAPTTETVLPARAILWPRARTNTVLAREDAAHFPLDGATSRPATSPATGQARA